MKKALVLLLAAVLLAPLAGAAGTTKTVLSVVEADSIASPPIESDGPTVELVTTGQHAWPEAEAVPNQVGGDLILSAGIGTRNYVVTSRAATTGDTYDITINGGTPTTLTEGVSFVCAAAGTDAICAQNMAAAINTADIGLLATAVTTPDRVAIAIVDSTIYSLDIDTSDAAGLSLVEGPSGEMKAYYQLVSLAPETDSSTSGSIVGLSYQRTYEQASGTAANTDFYLNRTETAVGSGLQYLIDAQVATITKFNVANTGVVDSAAHYLSKGEAPSTISGINSAAYGGTGIMFEGFNDDDFETFITATNATADRTVTIQDLDGTIPLIGSAGADGPANAAGQLLLENTGVYEPLRLKSDGSTGFGGQLRLEDTSVATTADVFELIVWDGGVSGSVFTIENYGDYDTYLQLGDHFFDVGIADTIADGTIAVKFIDGGGSLLTVKGNGDMATPGGLSIGGGAVAGVLTMGDGASHSGTLQPATMAVTGKVWTLPDLTGVLIPAYSVSATAILTDQDTFNLDHDGTAGFGELKFGAVGTVLGSDDSQFWWELDGDVAAGVVAYDFRENQATDILMTLSGRTNASTPDATLLLYGSFLSEGSLPASLTNANSAAYGGTGMRFEGSSADAVETLVTITNPTSVSKTVTVQDLTGTIPLIGSAGADGPANAAGQLVLDNTGAFEALTVKSDGDGAAQIRLQDSHAGSVAEEWEMWVYDNGGTNNMFVLETVDFETYFLLADSGADLAVEANVAAGTHVFQVLDNAGGTVLWSVEGDGLVDGKRFEADTAAADAGTVANIAQYGGTGIVFEGSSGNTSETTLTLVDPTADRTITLPDQTGTVTLQSYGDLYDDDEATVITVTTAGVYYGWDAEGSNNSSGAGYVVVDTGAAVNCTGVSECDMLTIGADGAGDYFVSLTASFSAGANDAVEAAVHLNQTTRTNVHLQRTMAATPAVGAAPAQGILTLAAGDDLDVRFTSDTNSDTITVMDLNLTIMRIGG